MRYDSPPPRPSGQANVVSGPSLHAEPSKVLRGFSCFSCAPCLRASLTLGHEGSLNLRLIDIMTIVGWISKLLSAWLRTNKIKSQLVLELSMLIRWSCSVRAASSSAVTFEIGVGGIPLSAMKVVVLWCRQPALSSRAMPLDQRGAICPGSRAHR